MIEWRAPLRTRVSAVWLSPVGPMRIVYQGDALVTIEFVSERAQTFAGHQRDPADWVVELLEGAFNGCPIGVWPAVCEGLTELDRRLLSQATEVPYGTTCSYGTLADWAGVPGRARAAGRAMGRAPIAYLIPTHRIIRADGTAAEPMRDELNERLRQHEGIVLARHHGMTWPQS